MEIIEEKTMSFNNDPAKKYRFDNISTKPEIEKVVHLIGESGMKITKIDVLGKADEYEKPYSNEFDNANDFFIPLGEPIELCYLKGKVDEVDLRCKISPLEKNIIFISSNTPEGIKALEDVTENFSRKVDSEKKTVDKTVKV